MRLWMRVCLGGMLLVLLAPPAPALGAAPEISLAKVFATSHDPAAYWVSEKYDGVRAVWDGSVLRFRSGRIVAAPEWFTAGLPPQALDGELWLGRGRFDELAAIVRKAIPIDEEWRRVRYMIFDLPGSPGDFSARLRAMAELLAASGLPQLEAVVQFRVATREELARRLAEVVQAGGEGLMLHRADAWHRGGRSEDLLKLKPWQDAEAIVVGHLPGRGRLAGQTAALLMEMPDGKRFRLGSGLGETERRRPPPLGSRLTYRYQELTPRGLPRFARYWRLREDF